MKTYDDIQHAVFWAFMYAELASIAELMCFIALDYIERGDY